MNWKTKYYQLYTLLYLWVYIAMLSISPKKICTYMAAYVDIAILSLSLSLPQLLISLVTTMLCLVQTVVHTRIGSRTSKNIFLCLKVFFSTVVYTIRKSRARYCHLKQPRRFCGGISLTVHSHRYSIEPVWDHTFSVDSQREMFPQKHPKSARGRSSSEMLPHFWLQAGSLPSCTLMFSLLSYEGVSRRGLLDLLWGNTPFCP